MKKQRQYRERKNTINITLRLKKKITVFIFKMIVIF